MTSASGHITGHEGHASDSNLTSTSDGSEPQQRHVLSAAVTVPDNEHVSTGEQGQQIPQIVGESVEIKAEPHHSSETLPLDSALTSIKDEVKVESENVADVNGNTSRMANESPTKEQSGNGSFAQDYARHFNWN